MQKLNVAIITGGDVAERNISLLSANTVFEYLDKDKYTPRIIDLKAGQFKDVATNIVLDRGDFTLTENGETRKFDLVYLMLHGHPAEDGILQAYFQLLNIPVTGCDYFVSGLTFNKQACKEYLKAFDIPMAPSKVIHQGQKINVDELAAMKFPLFVKPNKNGSSYGVYKIEKHEDLVPAIEKSFEFDNEVIVEGFLKGREFSNGVVRRGNEIVVLPVTEIIPEDGFFDYSAKYENKSSEEAPANITKQLTKDCQALTQKIYQSLGCKGICRVDYILVGDTFYMLEINTIPGMSPHSLIPQQTRAHGWTVTEILDAVIEEAMNLIPPI